MKISPCRLASRTFAKNTDGIKNYRKGLPFRSGIPNWTLAGQSRSSPGITRATSETYPTRLN